MKILHASGFSSAEYLTYRTVVRENLIKAIAELCQAVEKLGIDYESAECNSHSNIIKESVQFPISEQAILGAELSIQRLWSDSGVRQAYTRSHEFQLLDNAKYFLDNAARICHSMYEPTVEDILFCRCVTTGIVDVRFKIQQQNLSVIDVSGQRSARRKWIHCFDDVTTVIFIAAISEFDQVLREDNATNRLREALKLLDVTANSRWFKSTTFILFLNKMDIFKEKLNNNCSIKAAFSSYNGPNTATDCAAYIEARFLNKLKSREHQSTNRVSYCHFTCATSTNQISLVLADSLETILRENQSQTGFS